MLLWHNRTGEAQSNTASAASVLAPCTAQDILEAHRQAMKKGRNSEKTPMCTIFSEENSDKSLYFYGHHGHNYTAFYYNIMRNYRKLPLAIFELGIGSRNKSMPHNMAWMDKLEGRQVTPLASHRAWKRFFPYAKVYGCDIDEECIIQEGSIRTGLCDQTKPGGIAPLLRRFGVTFDFVVEDGMHEYTANVNAIRELWPFVKPGGLYFVEDIDKRAGMRGTWEAHVRKKDLGITGLEWGLYLPLISRDMVVLRKAIEPSMGSGLSEME